MAEKIDFEAALKAVQSGQSITGKDGVLGPLVKQLTEAALGLTPKQHSSGGKDRLLGISKRGDANLRSLLIHGARSTLWRAKHKEDRLSRWMTDLSARRHPNVAAVALANKTVRMAWAMMRNESNYDPEFAIA